MSSSNARRVPLFLSVHSRSSVQLKRNIFIQWNFNMNDFSSDMNSQQRFVVFRITSPFTLALRTNLHDINRTYTLYANWEHWLCTNRTSRSFEQLTTHNKVPVVLLPLFDEQKFVNSKSFSLKEHVMTLTFNAICVNAMNPTPAATSAWEWLNVNSQSVTLWNATATREVLWRQNEIFNSFCVETPMNILTLH